MRRILYYSLLCLLWVSVNSCKEDEAAQPPTPTFTVNRTSGLYQSTEFEFTIEQVSANSVSLLPYGTEQPNTPGILVPASAFTDGKATVKFVYGQVGTFNAVVVSNNHNGSGESVKNSTSSPTAITITSDRTLITEFSLISQVNVRGENVEQGSSFVDLTSINEDLAPEDVVYDTTASPRTIKITVPYGTDLTTLKAKFKTSDFASVSVGGTAQESEKTANNFSSPVTFSVTSQNEAETTDYVVTVVTTPISTDNQFTSFQGLIAKDDGTAGKVLPAYVDAANGNIVLYDTLHTIADFDPANEYDSVALDFGIPSLTYVRWADNNHLAGKDTVDFNDDVTFTIVPQDSTGAVGPSEGSVEYSVFVTQAPVLHVNFSGLNPEVNGTSNEAFAVTMNVLVNTDLTSVASNFTFDLPAGATVTGVAVDDDNNGSVSDATGPFSLTLDYTKPVKLMVTIQSPGIPDYVATYTISATVLKP